MYIGQSYTATFTVRNAGTAPTAGNWVDELWLSTDQTFDGMDRPVGNEMWSVGPVAPGATYTLHVTFTLPSPAPGAWYLLLRADVNNWLAESNNANNLLAIPVAVDFAPTSTPTRTATPTKTPTAMPTKTPTVTPTKTATPATAGWRDDGRRTPARWRSHVGTQSGALLRR